jgi:trigger factor
MQVTETQAEGLKREFKVVVDAQEIGAQVDRRLADIGKTVRMPGFRPGKVPMKLLKSRYGQSVMGEVLEQTVNESSSRVTAERGLRPALQPKIDITSFHDGADLEFTMAVEILPDIEPFDFSTIELERLKAEPDDETIDQALTRLAQSRRKSEPVEEERPAQQGDIVVIDFKGTVDGVAREGMAMEGHELELGSNSFIPGFEDQLVGARAGESRTVTVTFPEGYQAADLAGKEAAFEVTVKELRKPVAAAIDDDLAKTFGMEGLQSLRDAVRERMQQDYASLSRARIKRALLDKLSESASFAVPEGMVQMEFDAIWKRLQEEKERGGLAPEDAEKTEEQLRDEYRAIAERRVRLGLLLAEVGRRNNLQVTPEEINRAVAAEAQRYPGQERHVMDFYRQNPQALDSIRAPIYEDKVVDFILEMAKVNERTVSAEELARDPDEAPAAA